MRFYQPRVNTFYLQRNVSRDFVRREKRLFEGGPVSVAAGEPDIDPSPRRPDRDRAVPKAVRGRGDAG